MRFRLSGQDTLLGAAVAALIQRRHPAAEVVYGQYPPAAVRGLRVALDDGGAWLFVSLDAEPGEALAQALAAGASAAIALESSLAEFDLALQALCDGDAGYVPLGLARWMAGAALGRVPQPVSPSLTVREREVLQLVARGHSNGEIAAELLISTNTVRTHLHSLSLKLEASSRTRMLANARARSIPEAFEIAPVAPRADRVPA